MPAPARRNNQVADAHQHFGLCDRRTFDDLDEVGWRADLQTSLAHDLDDRRGCPLALGWGAMMNGGGANGGARQALADL